MARPKRFQYRPLSKPITFMHSAWWEVGPLEFSVWHFPTAKPKHERGFTFRVRLTVLGHILTIDTKHLTYERSQ